MSTQVLNVSRKGDSTTPLGNLFQCSVTFTPKFLRTFAQNILRFSLWPFPLILSLCTSHLSLCLPQMESSKDRISTGWIHSWTNNKLIHRRARIPLQPLHDFLPIPFFRSTSTVKSVAIAEVVKNNQFRGVTMAHDKPFFLFLFFLEPSKAP